MTRTVSAWVTSGDDVLGVAGPFPVDVPRWSEVEPVVGRLEELLGVPVLVLRLLSVDGGEGGRDGHVTYHVEALERPVPGLLDQRLVAPGLLDDHELFRSPWARADGLRELLERAAGALAAAGRPVTGPVEQRRTWNLAGLFRLPTARGRVWLKTTPHFAADEATVIASFARVDPGLVPTLLGSGERWILMEHIPGEDCWGASPETVGAAMDRLVAAQAALASGRPPYVPEGRAEGVREPRPEGVRDWRAPVLAAQIRALLDGPVARELTGQELLGAQELANRWGPLRECGLPDTLVHGDFHPGNWRSDGGPPVVVDFADAHWGHPVLDGLRVHDFLPEATRASAARAWIDAWKAHVPTSDPARALALAEPLAHLTNAVRYQEFLDGIEPSERPYHQGDPADAIRAALRSAENPSPHFAPAGRPTGPRRGPLGRPAPLGQDQLMDGPTTFTFPNPLRLEGFGIRLREWSDDDVPDLVAMYDDPEIDRWTPVASPFDTEAALVYLVAAHEKRAEGRTVQLAITTDGGAAQGEILLFRSAVDERDVEIAYGVGAAYRGRGLASKAVRLLADYAVRQAAARRVLLRIEDVNTASEAVAKATGFVLTDDEPVVRTVKGREVVLRTWRLADGGEESAGDS